MRIAVIGTGAFGRNHLRVYRELARAGHSVQLVAAVDPSTQARAAAAAEYGIPVFASVTDMLSSGVAVDAASVTTPTVHHADAALALIAAGIDVLIVDTA